MTPDVRKRRPRQAAPPSCSAEPSVRPVDPRDLLAEQVAGTFVVVVEDETGHRRRRCFLSAAAAEASVRRAEAAGLRAVAYLAELRPLWLLAEQGGRAGHDREDRR